MSNHRRHPARAVLIAAAIACALLAMSLPAYAALVCTEVTRPDGTTGQACKNVPDQPTRPPSQAKPKPTPILTPAPVETPPPAQPQRPTPSTEAQTEAPRPIAEKPPADSPPAVTEASLSTLRQQLHQSIAQAAALVLLTPTATGRTTLNLAAAGYHGQSAVGITLGHRPTRQTFISLGVSAGTQQPTNTLWRISAGVQF